MIKIMIIEDDPAILLGLEDLFSEENYEIISSADGEEGLHKALAIFPDLIILDINLPTLNGLDVCRSLRKMHFTNPIIMLTARSEQVDKIIGLEIGADDYLTKPFDQKELLARVRANIRRSRKSASASITNREQSELRRKLLTIMFTDMKDYSKKMNDDEVLTIKLLKDHNEIMEKSIFYFQGNIIETVGDGYLVCFENTIDAVRCAQNTQSKFLEYNKLKPNKEKIEVRIGIHLGDVVEFEDKLKGDTLNITARIQQNAMPGKIAVSESVYSSIKNKIDVVVEEKASKTFKNIKDPITVYTLNSELLS